MNKDTWNTNQYEKFKDQRAQPLLDLISMLKPSKAPSVIDLGCGTGEWTLELHKQVKAKHTLGIDSSLEMMTKAKTFAIPGQLDFKLGDIQTWDPTQKYDIIFSNAALQWCSDHQQLLARFKEALTTNGQMAHQIPYNQAAFTHELAGIMSEERGWEKDYPTLTPEAYSRILFALGFSEQVVTTKVYGHVLESREAAFEWVKGTTLNRFKAKLSKDDYEAFLVEYKDRLFAETPDERPFFYPFTRILMWAKL